MCSPEKGCRAKREADQEERRPESTGSDGATEEPVDREKGRKHIET